MPIETNINNGVAEILFDHPPVNAFDSVIWNELPEIILDAGMRKDVRCVLIRANGKGFCAGVDIKELQADASKIVDVNKGNYRTFKSIRQCEIPVVSAPHGFVIGGGIGICGASDAVICSRDCFFSLPEIDRGAMGGAAHLQRLFPHAMVRAAFLTGGKISADEAYRVGGVAKVVENDMLYAEARKFAELIASKSRDALRIAKEALNGIEVSDVDRAYRWEQGFTFEMYMHEDSQKSRDAFVETGRAADFNKET